MLTWKQIWRDGRTTSDKTLGSYSWGWQIKTSSTTRSALRRGSQLYHYCKTSQRPNEKYLHGQPSTSVLSTTRHTGTVWRTLLCHINWKASCAEAGTDPLKTIQIFPHFLFKLGYVSSFWVILNGSFSILWSDMGLIVKVHGDHKTYLFSLEGTDE